MKTICFLISTLTGGGAERVTSIVASNLALRDDTKVYVVTFEEREKEYPLCDKVIRLNFGFNRGIKGLISLRKFLLSLNCNCYIGIDILANLLISALGMTSRKKTIISERNAPKQVNISKISKFLRAVLYPFADTIVFQTEGARNDYPKPLRKKGVIIPNPVKKDLPRCTPARHNICAAGRLVEEKNYYLLIDAFKRIVEKHPEYSLSIYG